MPGGASRVVKAGQLHLHISCYLGPSHGLLALRFGAVPAALSPLPAPPKPARFAAIIVNIATKESGEHTGENGREASLINWDACV